MKRQLLSATLGVLLQLEKGCGLLTTAVRKATDRVAEMVPEEPFNIADIDPNLLDRMNEMAQALGQGPVTTTSRDDQLAEVWFDG